MNRRNFVTGVGAALIGSSACRRFSKDTRRKKEDPLVRDLAQFTAEFALGQPLNGDVRGFKMDLEEDDHALFKFVVTNNGPNPIKIFHAYPDGPFYKVVDAWGPIGRVSGMVIHINLRACNDANFVCALVNTTGDKWDILDAQPGNVITRISNDNNVAHMEWHSQQEVHLEVQGNRGTEEAHC